MRPTGEWSVGVAYAQQPLNPVYNGAFRSGVAESIRTLQQTLILSGELGLSERFSLTGALPFRSVELTGEPIEETGFGDLQIGTRIALTHPEKASRFSAVATGGAWLPTGSSNTSETIGENFSFTSGVVTLTAGGEFSWRLGTKSRLFGVLDARYPTGADDVEDPNGNPARYRFAPSRDGALTFSRPFPGDRVTWLLGMSQRYYGADKMNGETVETRGGAVRRIVGGLVFHIGPRQTIGILAERLAHANVNGLDRSPREGQILATTEFVVAWQGTFGAHRHADESGGD